MFPHKQFIGRVLLVLALLSLFPPIPAFGVVEPCPPGVFPPDLLISGTCFAHSPTITLLLQRAVRAGLISGGVVLIGNSSGILSVSARGRVNRSSRAPFLDDRTIFDVASLTKVVATAPAVMKLVESGEVSLSDPLVRWFPEFKGSRNARITVRDLLTHTSGLADLRARRGQSVHALIRKAAREKGPRSYFNYADINFILLGELVHRVSGRRLDVFCREHLFGPLGMRETMFLPPKRLDGIIAPTTGASGVVQDLNARRLGSVAGHAGLFTSAHDLSRYARLVLGGGTLDGKRIFSERSIAQMISPHLSRSGLVTRGLGWDINSPFSAPKGRLFSDRSFGHTGYSGSSMWIDPESDLYVILLTNRRDYRNVHSFNRLRRDVSTIAAAQFGTLDTGRYLLAQNELSRITKTLLTGHRKSLTAMSHPKFYKIKYVRRHRFTHLRSVR